MRNRTYILVAAASLGASLMAACGDDEVDPFPTTTSSSGGGGAGAEGGAGGQGGAGAEGGAGGQGGAGAEGGAGGQGGGGGGAPTGADTCPGDAYDVALGDTLTLPGTTVGLAGDYASYCGVGSGSGPEAVYALTATASGTMTVSLESSNGLNGVVYAQESCGDPALGSFINCQDQGAGTESFSFDAQEGMVYYVFADGRDQTQGDYVLTATLQQGVCGDGVINAPNEDCDFGDTNPGDGCAASCQFEPPSDNSDTCPGQFYTVDAGVPLALSSFTTGYTDDYTSCGAVTGAPDRVFAIVVTSSGTLTVTLPNLGPAGGGFDGVLAAWAGSCAPGNVNMPPYLGCSDGANASDTETLTFPVTVGTVYFIVVDGYAGYSYGNFQLDVSLN
ncbi:MAG: hypothetical protein IT372_17485 [Polyangiaceae bacterium]|nr:hypothetical protein [Polyangiaceae bacterium]